jgi:hypothetical protein
VLVLDIIPKRALFAFEIPIDYCAKPPRVDGDVSKWTRKFLAPALVELEGEEPIADVYWAWNEDGFYAAFDVPNRHGLPESDVKPWWKADGIRLCLDTRDARDIKRATRFCHFFYLLPLGGGAGGRQPVVGTHRMSHAKETPPASDLTAIRSASHVTRSGYSLEVALPASCLHGWDPAEHPRIGIFYKIRDTQLGPQHLSADDEMGWNADPSTWATGVLVQ